MNTQLADDIKRIIILSHYEIECGGNWGGTAEEILIFEKRAIDKYLGRTDDPHKVVSNVFHARVQRDVALIMRAIEENV